MITGTIGMVAAFVLLFNVPVLPLWSTIAWVGVSYFALATLYSMFAVPYTAIPPEISSDRSTLARLVSWRMMLVMIGILAGAAGAPNLVQAGGGGLAGYGVMGWSIGGLCLIAMSLPLIMLRGRDRPGLAPTDNAQRSKLVADIVATMKNVNFRKLSLAFLLQATAFGAFSAIIPYAVTKGLGKSDADIGIALGAYLLTTIFAVPLWSFLGKKIGLRSALISAACAYGISASSIGLMILLQPSWPIALTIMAFAGIPFAGLQVLPFTMVGDLIREEAADAEGRFSGIWTAVEKLGLAFGAVLVGQTIDLSQGGMAIGIATFLCVIPVSLCLISTIFLTTAKVPA
jgi:glycoside/pentoside/hexuronide:cation symporter, GPH family